ncbi:MAG: hypothetical protein WAX89_02860 [Alphaproteobacteria bacterium]
MRRLLKLTAAAMVAAATMAGTVWAQDTPANPTSPPAPKVWEEQAAAYKNAMAKWDVTLPNAMNDADKLTQRWQLAATNFTDYWLKCEGMWFAKNPTHAGQPFCRALTNFREIGSVIDPDSYTTLTHSLLGTVFDAVLSNVANDKQPEHQCAATLALQDYLADYPLADATLLGKAPLIATAHKAMEGCHLREGCIMGMTGPGRFPQHLSRLIAVAEDFDGTAGLQASMRMEDLGFKALSDKDVVLPKVCRLPS